MTMAREEDRASELREFLGRMRGRNPQEMIGLVANSGLTRSMLLATFLFVLVLGAFTVIPYFLGEQVADAPGPAPPAPVENATPPRPGGDPSAAVPEPDVVGEAAGRDPERAVDAMGIGEARVADPDENPLEDKLDDLLEGID